MTLGCDQTHSAICPLNIPPAFLFCLDFLPLRFYFHQD